MSTIQDLELILKTQKEVAVEKQQKLLQQLILDYQYKHVMEDEKK